MCQTVASQASQAAKSVCPYCHPCWGCLRYSHMGNATSCFVDVFAGEHQQPTASSTTEDGTPTNPKSRRTPRGPISARSASVNHMANGVVPQVRPWRKGCQPADKGGCSVRVCEVFGAAESSVVEQGPERGAYGWRGWNAQAELQSNLKELDRILANLEEDLQELHTTPATARGEPVFSKR